jgi:L-fucose isomerase
MAATPVNRNTASLPKIGIRPTIDGRRRGVRESLENQTMDLAKSVAELYTKNLRHPCGLPVECVIADTCIGGAQESHRCAEKFARAGVGVSLTVTPCWCYGSETMDMDPLTPKGVWGFNGTERPGAVYLAAVMSAHAQKGLPAFSIYGRDVQDVGTKDIPADVREKLLRFARAGLAAASMRGKSYLSLGSTSMGIAGSIPNTGLFENYLGMRFESVDMIEIERRLDRGIYDAKEFDRAMAWTKKNCREGENFNGPKYKLSPAEMEKAWETSVKMAMIVKDMMNGNPALAAEYGEEALGHDAILAGFQGQRAWTDHRPNGDFMETLLNSSFDWTGIRQPYVVATENDALNGIAMLFGHYLTGAAQVFADVRTYWSPEAVKRVTGHQLSGVAAGGLIHLINSGAAALDGTGLQKKDGKACIKPWWEVTDAEAAACLAATDWFPGITEYFRGGGYSSGWSTQAEMPVTMLRLNFVKHIGPVLQIAEGHTAVLPAAAHKTLTDRTDKTWPTTWFAPRCGGNGAFRDAYSVMANWGANHGSFAYGHIGADVLALAATLRIPVSLHNVPEETVFRPHAWSAFGTADLEGADYRACAAYGPIYG